ncbi:hypothetical protein H2203_003182 [Taxawa tesnikishii (nom. ined.)]|nr:hypothetical protein H2203_003182 [Dothideales sp. JES 119]
MSKTETKDKLTSSLDKLSISTPPKVLSKPAKKAPIADSWEDEPSDTDEAESSAIPPSSVPLSPTSDLPRAPPPTPAVPFHTPDFPGPGDSTAFGYAGKETPSERRPEKSTAVASRLIAAGLGVRAPRRTEEQRQYDKALREQERKKRDRERDEAVKKKEQAEQAKAAVWDD